MGNLRNFVTPLHISTSRNYFARMADNKVYCMNIARKFGLDFWDGERRYGYGGYKYIPGRWKQVAESLITTYKLGPNASVLDIGCGKGFLLHELLLIEPSLKVIGLDISEYAIASAPKTLEGSLFVHSADKQLTFNDNDFDLVVSLGTLHNLKLQQLEVALPEIERVGKQAYIMVESYRNELELFNLQCWALTCESFLDENEWSWLFNKFKYSGDYEFIFFE